MKLDKLYYTPLCSSLAVCAALVVAGISGCGNSQPPPSDSVYVSHESPAGNPIWKVTATANDTNCPASQYAIAELNGKQVRDLKVALVNTGSSQERRFYALVTSAAANGNVLAVVRDVDFAMLAMIPVGAQAQALAISPQSQSLYVVRTPDNPIYRIDLAGNAIAQTASPLDAGNPAFTNASSVIVRRTAANQDQLWIGDAGTGSLVVLDQNLAFVTRVAIQSGASVLKVALSPDGKTVYATTNNTATSLWAVDASALDTGATPGVVAVPGLSSAEALDAGKGQTVRVVSYNSSSAQYEEQQYDFSNPNPASTKLIGATFANRPANLFYSASIDSTFASERSDSRVRCLTSVIAPTLSTPVGLSGLVNVQLPVSPSPVNVTINTNPSGRSFQVDTLNFTTAQARTWYPGATHFLNATTPQTASGTRSTFTGWSDGNANPARGYTTPGSAATVTANYSTEYLLTVTTGAGGTVTATPPSPTSDGYYPANTVVTLTANPNPGLVPSFSEVDSFSGNTATVTMNAARNVNVTFSSGTTPVTYATQGVWICTNGGLLGGCGTSTLSVGTALVNFTGVGSGTIPASGSPYIATFGAIATACQGGGTGCPFVTIPGGVNLRITVMQTGPSAGSGDIAGGVPSGQIAGFASSAIMTWTPGAGLSFVDIPRLGGVVRYSILNSPIALVPPSTNAGVTTVQGSIVLQ